MSKNTAISQLIIGLLSAIALAACDSQTPVAQVEQAEIDARGAEIVEIDGYRFKDLNKNGSVDGYEDWRLTVPERVDNLIGQMTLEEKVGMMLIDTLNAGRGGAISDVVRQYINDEKMTRFIFRNPILLDADIDRSDTNNTAANNPFNPPDITAFEAASFLNLAQETAESTRLGIPLLFKSNPRNHVDPDPRFGISAAAGALSAWPKPAGLAATGDMQLVAEFAEAVRSEWMSLGIRGMYGYTLDLATEPRWYRVHETFSEDAKLTSEIATILVSVLQGESLSRRGIALTVKHFPGGGPQERGGDPHYDFGKNQVYPANRFDDHVQPFRAAIDAGVAAIMPYYGIPVDQDVQPNDVGMAFSKGVITGLLRDELGFNGVVNSDTGIIGERSWGLEDKTEAERVVIAIEAGNDVLSGFHSNAMILDLVNGGQLSEARVDESVRRLLSVQFRLGLFENPYVDPGFAESHVGNREFQTQADIAQRRSVVLIKNDNQLLPLRSTDGNRPAVYSMGFEFDVETASSLPFDLTFGDYDPANGEVRLPVPDDTDAAIIRVIVNNDGAPRALFFGGATPEELDLLSFSDMATAGSWNVMPRLSDIRAVMSEVGAHKTVLAIYFRQPYVLDEGSGLRDAGAILGTFGVTDEALIDVIAGEFSPTATLPFALAANGEAIVRQAPDAPGYDDEDTLYPFGWGLKYE